jgi:hypothetical protein
MTEPGKNSSMEFYTNAEKEPTEQEKARNAEIETRMLINKLAKQRRDAWIKAHPKDTPLPREGREFGEAISKYLSGIPMVSDLRTKLDGLSAAIQDLSVVAEIRMDPELQVKCYVLSNEWKLANAGFDAEIPETWAQTQFKIHTIVTFAKKIVYTWDPPICTKLIAIDLMAQSTTMNQ